MVTSRKDIPIIGHPRLMILYVKDKLLEDLKPGPWV